MRRWARAALWGLAIFVALIIPPAIISLAGAHGLALAVASYEGEIIGASLLVWLLVACTRQFGRFIYSRPGLSPERPPPSLALCVGFGVLWGAFSTRGVIGDLLGGFDGVPALQNRELLLAALVVGRVLSGVSGGIVVWLLYRRRTIRAARVIEGRR